MAKRDNDEIVKDLLAKDEEFKRAYMAHRGYEAELSELNKKAYLTTEEQMKKKKIQKLKLAEKDRMEMIISRHK